MDKPALRLEAKRRRRQLSEADRAHFSFDVCERVWTLIRSLVKNHHSAASTPDMPVVAGYYAVRGEVRLHDLQQTLLAHQHPYALPVILAPDAPLGFALWRPGMRLVNNSFGIPEPEISASTRSQAAAQPELQLSPELTLPHIILCPLLGFDRQGQRLGYGGGYYDRTLASLSRSLPVPPVAIGVSFACQEFDALPVGPHDRALDYIVTEQELITVQDRQFS